MSATPLFSKKAKSRERQVDAIKNVGAGDCPSRSGATERWADEPTALFRDFNDLQSIVKSAITLSKIRFTFDGSHPANYIPNWRRSLGAHGQRGGCTERQMPSEDDHLCIHGAYEEPKASFPMLDRTLRKQSTISCGLHRQNDQETRGLKH